MDDQNGHMLVNVKLNGQLYQRNLAADLEVDLDKPLEALMRQAALYGWWGSLRSLASNRVARAEAHVLKQEHTLIAEFTKESGNKLSNEKVIAKARSAPLYLSAKEELVQAHRDLEVLDNAVRALEQRKDMLVLLIVAATSNVDLTNLLTTGHTLPKLDEALKRLEGQDLKRLSK